ncbi:MAG: glycosyltransferase family 39 protein [Deltaproteobacteria bacterium]|nr:glycosyltransferase family 39 protein [Deltaproteobacteria bacterium]
MPLLPRLSPRAAAIAIAVGGCALLFVIPLATRSLTMADEGYLLLQSLDMANGKILYRDMDAFVTPGMWFLLAGLFKLVEPSVIASRVPVVIAYLVLIALCYRIPARFGGAFAGIASVVIMMVSTVWAYPGWTFAFYSPFSMLAAIAALERLLAFHDSALRRDLALVGLLLGLSILFKQNYGTFALAGACLSLIVFRYEVGESAVASFRGAVSDALWLGAGIALIALPTVAYFGVHGALGDAFQSLVVHPFEFSGMHDIPYLDIGAFFAPNVLSETLDIMIYGAQPLYRTPMPDGIINTIRLIERLHVLLYWFPPLIFIMGCTLALGSSKESQGLETQSRARPIRGELLGVLLVCFAVFLGVFPRADFNHLMNVYQAVVIAGVASFAVLFGKRSGASATLRRVVGAAVAIILSLYFLVSAYWYYALIESIHVEVVGSRGGVKISRQEASSLHQVLRNLERVSQPGDALLTIPDLAMLNFLSKRPMPSAYYNLYEHHISHDAGAAVAAGAEAKHATVAVTRMNNFFSDRVGFRDYAPVLADYIDTHFEQRYTIGRSEYLLYTRRVDAVESEVFVSVLEGCEREPGKTEIKEHLLFWSLYQTTGPGVENREDTVVTRCRVTVPKAGGDFVWQMDYPRPVLVRGPTTLYVEVAIEAEQKSRRVFSEMFDVKPGDPRISRTPAAREYRVDLSDYAGQSVELILRSTRAGHLAMSANELRGFGTRWQNPRIVERRGSRPD